MTGYYLTCAAHQEFVQTSAHRAQPLSSVEAQKHLVAFCARHIGCDLVVVNEHANEPWGYDGPAFWYQDLDSGCDHPRPGPNWKLLAQLQKSARPGTLGATARRAFGPSGSFSARKQLGLTQTQEYCLFVAFPTMCPHQAHDGALPEEERAAFVQEFAARGEEWGNDYATAFNTTIEHAYDALNHVYLGHCLDAKQVLDPLTFLRGL